MNKLLVINAGSSSMKFKVFARENLVALAEGLAERIFVDGRISINVNGEKFTKDVPLKNHLSAVEEMLKLLEEHKVVENLDEIIGVGHRVVQGGEKFKNSILIDEKVVDDIDHYSKLAPLHNPPEVAAIKAFMKETPNAKHVAVFDTSFHQTMEPEAFMYGVPLSWYKDYDVRKYGMHGTSHKYITLASEKILNKEKVNIISAHLGNGASLAAVKGSKSINTSMGLTPLAGIIMGTRSGDLDPAIVEYMCKETGKSVEEITDELNRKSGVLGLSGVSSDFRDIEAAANSGNEDAKNAIAIYAKRVADFISQYQNDLENKVDALIFTAGVGENASLVRSEIMKRVHTLDAKIDEEQNKRRDFADHLEISTTESKVKVFVVRTDEEKMIVEDLIEQANL